MIELNACNIKKAIVEKALDMVDKNRAGFIYTNETVCIFNSMFIFDALFRHKCSMLDNALEKLYYIAYKLFRCKEKDEDDYYNVTVVTIPVEATAKINGIATKKRSLAAGSQVVIVASLEGYYDKTVVIESLNEDKVITIEFTDDDKKPEFFNVSVFANPEDATITINGQNTSRTQVAAGQSCTVVVSKPGYQTYTSTFVVNEDKQLFVNLERARCSVTIVTNPSDANCTINGISTKQTVVDYGTEITVVVSKTGYQTKTQTYTITSDRTIQIDLAQVTPTTGTVTIVAKDANTSAVISSPTVTIDGVSGATQTLSYGQHTAIVSKSGYVTATKTFTVSNPSQTVEVLLTPQQQQSEVTVNVMDYETNQPITGCSVNFNGPPNVSATEQGNGVYIASLSPGSSYTLFVSKTGYDNHVGIRSQYSDGEVINVRLRRLINATVNLVDDTTGLPITTGSVLLRGGADLYLDNNEDGSYTDEIPIDTYTIRGSAPGYVSEEVASTSYNQDFTITLRLVPIVSTILLTVNVLDNTDDSVINGATVIIHNEDTGDDYTGVEQNNAYVAEVPEGRYSIHASKSGYIGNSLAADDYQGNETVTIKLNPYVPPVENIILTVEVTDATTGNHISGAHVELTGDEDTYLAIEQSPGIYQVGVFPGTYSVEVTKQGYIPGTVAATAYSQNTTIPVALTQAPSDIVLTIDVTESGSGSHVTGATVQVTTGVTTRNATDQGDGTYTISVEPGTYSITVSKAGYNTATIGAAAYNANTTIPVTLTPSSPPPSDITLTIIVKDRATDAGITNALIQVVDTSVPAVIRNPIEQGNGVYTIDVTPGIYGLIASKAGYVTGYVSDANYTNNDTVTIYLDAEAPTPSNINITVNVTDSYTSEAISGATVTLSDGISTYNATYQSNGNYVATVPEGNYSILVQKSGYTDGTVASTSYTQDTTVYVVLTHTGIRVEIDTTNHPGATVTMNGESKTVGYYQPGDIVVAEATLSGYNKEIWHIRVDENNLVIPLQMSQATTTPDSNVTLQIQAIEQPQIAPFLNAQFIVDNDQTVNQGGSCVVSMSSHIITINKTGYQSETFEHGYTGDTDVYFVLAANS